MSKNYIEDYRFFVLTGMTFIGLGVTFSSVMKESMGSIGPVFIALGGLFFIIGMSKKRKEDTNKKE